MSTVPILVQAISTMRAIGEGRAYGSMAQMARELGLATTTCFRILKTLESEDWVRQTGGGEYRISVGMLPLLKGLTPVRELVDAADGPMRELTERVGLATKLSVREGLRQVVVHRVESRRGMAATSRVGSRFALMSGSSGAALAAGEEDAVIERWIGEMDEEARAEQSAEDVWKRVAQCRRMGVCENIGRNPRGLDTISAAVKSAEGATVGAITVIGLRGDFGKDVRVLRAAVKEAAELCNRAVKASGVNLSEAV